MLTTMPSCDYFISPLSTAFVPSEPAFNGQSYLVLPSTNGSFLNVSLSITLTPTSPDGLLLLIATNSMDTGDFLAVGLKNGSVKLHFSQMDMVNNELCVESSDRLVTGNLSTIDLTKRGTRGSVQVNQGQVAYGDSTGDHRYLHISDDALMYVGGHPTWDGMPLESYELGFQGCVHEIVFNGRRMDLSQAQSSRETSQCSSPSGV